MKGRKLVPLLVIAAGLLAYHNSFTGEFICDDVGSIPENSTIHTLWPTWQCLSPPHRGGLTVEGRPLINLSLAINRSDANCKVDANGINQNGVLRDCDGNHGSTNGVDRHRGGFICPDTICYSLVGRIE